MNRWRDGVVVRMREGVILYLHTVLFLPEVESPLRKCEPLLINLQIHTYDHSQGNTYGHV